jgi:hypothetical protein
LARPRKSYPESGKPQRTTVLVGVSGEETSFEVYESNLERCNRKHLWSRQAPSLLSPATTRDGGDVRGGIFRWGFAALRLCG